MDAAIKTEARAKPWNKGKLLGQRPPLKLKEIWAIRIRLQLTHRSRELALFNLAIDSKLRGCDLVGLHVHDVVQGSRVASRAIVMQKKTQRSVQFEITEQTRDSVAAWVAAARLKPEQFLFPADIGLAASIDSAVFADRGDRGRLDWTGPGGLRHAFIATHESHADLPADPRISAPFSSCSGTQSLKAPSGTSGSRSTTHWRSPSRPKYRSGRRAAAGTSNGRGPAMCRH